MMSESVKINFIDDEAESSTSASPSSSTNRDKIIEHENGENVSRNQFNSI